VFVVHQLVVFYWRGSWLVLDFYLFPDNKPLSAVVCLAIGYALQSLLCIAQPFFNVLYMTAANADEGTPADAGSCRRWILETIVYFFGNLVSVVHWRGFWMLLDIYVMPGQPDAAAAVEHVVGIVGLWLMLAGHSVTLVGCSLDGGSELKDGCLIRNQYIRYFVNRSRSCSSDITVMT
jgi:Fuseless